MLTVGKSVPRLDALSKVTGTAVYARDLSVPGMLHMKLVFAGRPHARIVGLDTAQALASPGVHAVFTARDVPHNLYGLMIADQPVFCSDVVRFVGDRVAAVVAETPEQAAAAAALVVVQYEDLPVLADPDQALRPGAPVLHAEHPDNVLRTIRSAPRRPHTQRWPLPMSWSSAPTTHHTRNMPSWSRRRAWAT